MKDNRSICNKAIVHKLTELVNEYPDLRFGQILMDAGVIQLKEVLLEGQRETVLFVEDCFNEESETTYRRMCGNKMCFPDEGLSFTKVSEK